MQLWKWVWLIFLDINSWNDRDTILNTKLDISKSLLSQDQIYLWLDREPEESGVLHMADQVFFEQAIWEAKRKTLSNPKIQTSFFSDLVQT